MFDTFMLYLCVFLFNVAIGIGIVWFIEWLTS